MFITINMNMIDTSAEDPFLPVIEEINGSLVGAQATYTETQDKQVFEDWCLHGITQIGAAMKHSITVANAVSNLCKNLLTIEGIEV